MTFTDERIAIYYVRQNPTEFQFLTCDDVFIIRHRESNDKEVFHMPSPYFYRDVVRMREGAAMRLAKRVLIVRLLGRSHATLYPTIRGSDGP